MQRGVTGANVYRAVTTNGQTIYWLVGTIANTKGADDFFVDNTNLDITTIHNGVAPQNRVVEEPDPQWQPLTDQFPTLSMTSIVIDPNNPYRAFAGTGNASASHQGGPGQGIIMMTVNPDPPANNTAVLLGASTFAGLNISAIQILPGNRLLVASDDADQGGIWSAPLTPMQRDLHPGQRQLAERPGYRPRVHSLHVHAQRRHPEPDPRRSGHLKLEARGSTSIRPLA